MKVVVVALCLVLAALPCPAPACSLCGSLQNQQTFRHEIEQAPLVLYGSIANPRFVKNGAPGAGVTDLHVLRELKPHADFDRRKVIELPRYLPVVDPKNPPKFVVFCKFDKGKLNAYHGRAIRSDAVLKYLEGASAFKAKDRTAALLYYFRFLDHEDETIAGDAFLEFARSSDQEVGQVARHLPDKRLRKLLANPKTPGERLGLYAFLLGAVGGDQDAELLRGMILKPSERHVNALDGLLSGYIHLRPRAGWDLATAILADSKRSFSERFAVARTLRFYQGWKPAETRKEVLRCLAVMIPDGEIADLAIDDLRRWKMWDLTGAVLSQHGKASHDSPITRRTIVRYAISCPEPAARQFVSDLRRRDPELIRELEEALAAENQ
jgi:hypothetical protein